MFKNREEAGALLAAELSDYKKRPDAIVIAIPRGGVVVGKQIATKLSLPLSIIVVKKLGAPNNPELAIGAVAQHGVKYVDWELALRSGVEQEYLYKEIREKSKEIEEREKKFSPSAGGLELRIRNKKAIILTDDGIATGATTLAAIKYLKKPFGKAQGRQKTLRQSSGQAKNIKQTIILAVPVVAKSTYDRLQSEVDKIITLEAPETFGAVGEFYNDFPQVNDEEVVKLLKSLK